MNLFDARLFDSIITTVEFELGKDWIISTSSEPLLYKSNETKAFQLLECEPSMLSIDFFSSFHEKEASIHIVERNVTLLNVVSQQ